MLSSLDNLTVFLGTVTLVLLSVYTIEKCRADTKEHLYDNRQFLFAGTRRLHSLASCLGAIFSATYFFGATFIYGNIFRGLLLLITIVTFFAVVYFTFKVVDAAILDLPAEKVNDQRSNLLLEILQIKLNGFDFQKLTALYIAIYFGLLVEELAVSRLVLSTLFPFHPAITTLMLATICFVIIAYLYAGGFRAVLISDYEQLKILIAFAATLSFMIYRDSPGNLSSEVLSLPANPNPLGIVCAIIFGVSWFAASIDFYSRLNFQLGKGETAAKAYKEFILISVVLLALFLSLGVIFGAHLGQVMPTIESPSGYTEAAISYFLVGQSRVIGAVFFAGLFCMIFTTLDTLAFTMLQLGAYKKSAFFQKANIVKIFLAAVVVSAVIELDSVSAIGIFIGSMLIIPMIPVMELALARRVKSSINHLLVAAALSVLIFVVCFDKLKLTFDRHFLIPGIVSLAAVVSLALGAAINKAARLLRRRRC